MEAECYPIGAVPGTTALFRDFCDWRSVVSSGSSAASAHGLARWYGADPFAMDWMRSAPQLSEPHRERLADALLEQAKGFGAGAAALENIEELRAGAAAVVTGQQVGLFGGPLLTLLKAATAIRKAQDATRLSGRKHVPVFWLASEDHDLEEVDQVTLPAKSGTETLRLGLDGSRKLPVGNVPLQPGKDGGSGAGELQAMMDQLCELLGWAPIGDVVRECYAPGATLAGAFGRLLTRVFAEFGLVLMDGATREFHALGADVLRAGLEQVDELEVLLEERSAELTANGYHAQVLVARGHSLLFLIDRESAARLPLRRVSGTAEAGEWKAGSRSYSTAELLEILEAEPERLSPSALLRPVFQDCILPTAAYVGGPAEIAYFAQSGVIYERVLGRVTPVLPRLSATLVGPPVAKLLAGQEISVPQVWEAKSGDGLAMRMGARAMPVEAKHKLSGAGNAMDTELTALTEYMTAMSADLGRAAGVAASKMRYQMNRLRRLAASFELQKSASLQKAADAIVLELYPDAHLQERLLAGVWFLGQFGESLPGILVEHAGQECPGHRVLTL